jgi:ribosomal-protein-alanine N-acetyltransferase
VSGIETARLRLRMWRDEDLDAYARMCADPEAMRYISGGATRTREQCEATIARFVRAWEERGYGMWAAEEKETGELIGRVGLLYHADWPEDHKTEVGWQVDRSRWGRGLATEGALASLRYGFEEARLERIISLAVPRNLASRRVMEKAGLSFRGERRWRDVDLVWYAIDRRDWQSANP